MADERDHETSWSRKRWVWIAIALLIALAIAGSPPREPAPVAHEPSSSFTVAEPLSAITPTAESAEPPTDDASPPPKVTIGPSLVGALQALAGSKGREIVDTKWIGTRLVASVRAPRATIFLEWNDLRVEPRQIARVSGAVYEIDPSPSGTLATRSVPMWDGESGTYQEVTDRTVTGRFVDIATGAQQSFPRVPNTIYRRAWSPDGRRIAFSDGRENDQRWITYVVDVATGIAQVETPVELDLNLKVWDEKGLVLTRGNDCYRWEPGLEPEPTKATCPPEYVSSDGAYRLEYTRNGMVVVAKDGTRRTFLHDPVDLQFSWGLLDTQDWLGPHRVIFEKDEAHVVLSLDTLELRALGDGPKLRYLSHSADGTLVLFERDGTYHWAQVEPERSRSKTRTKLPK